MAKTAQLHHLLEQQNELFEVISESVSKLKAGSKITCQRIQSRMNALTENWNTFRQNHNTLGSIKSTLKAEARSEYTEDPYFKGKRYSECEQIYLDALEDMTIMLEALPPKTTADGSFLADTSIVRQSSTTTNVRLPTYPLDLLTFSGDYSEWLTFKDTFTSVIGAHTSLTCVEKLQYLKGCLVGKASQRMQNLPLTAANFKVAWDDLVEYYDNKRILVDAALELLFSSKSIARESADDLEALLNDVNQALGSLEGLGRQVDQWDEVLVYMVSRKLDSVSVKEWERKLGPSTEPPTWKELKEFIQTRIRSLQALERRLPKHHELKKQASSSSVKHQQFNKAKSHHVSAKKSNHSCSNCKGEHYIAACTDYQQKTTEQRLQLLKQLKLCFNCLGQHQISACFSRKRCSACGGHHHTSIHSSENVSNDNQPEITQRNITSGATASSNAAHVYQSHTSTLLATALVKTTSAFGESYFVRALLDQGSEINLISEHLCQTLRLERLQTSLSIVGIGAEASSSHKTRGQVTVELSSCINDFTCTFDALILPKLTSYLPSTQIEVSDWPHLRNLQLADPEYFRPRRIDLVLGAGFYSQIIQSGLQRGPKEAPIAQETSLGWIISGSVLSTASSSKCNYARSLHCHIDNELNELVKRFWLQEEVFRNPTDQLTPEEARCEEIFKTTHYRNSEGRYVVRLPFRFHPNSFGDSRSLALGMLHRMEKRFSINPDFHENYSNFITEYEHLGHMHRTSLPPKSPEKSFYLPHHGVVRESSSTTKLRVVFNGSQKTQKGISLNDCLYEGPKLQVDLPDVLTRWRKNEFAFSCDVVKMFRQILVHSDDWDYQRILWLEGSRLVEYVLTTVTYGTSPAPYLANKVLRQLAKDEGLNYPYAAEVIEQNTYVDDIYGGAASIDTGKQNIKQIIELFKAGGFPLQKWTANDTRLLDDIPESSQAPPSINLSIEENLVHRTLGLNWQPSQDCFVFIPNETPEEEVWTKRKVLSRIAKLFDPLGWLSPVVIRGKIFMQELWELNIGWDVALPSSLESRWRTYVHQLNDLPLVSVPRWLGISPSTLSIEIHGFADASQVGLGAVVYLRVVEKTNSRITIISSKSKVAPIRHSKGTSKRSPAIRVTIPRLELSAALLLTRHVEHLQKVLAIESATIHLWTDSSTTLHWVQGEPTRWKDFVRNRVARIQSLLPNAQWHHLPGESNPADLASRGLPPQQLAKSTLWWHGPPWLQLHHKYWPQLLPNVAENIDLEERNRTVAATKRKDDNDSDLLKRYSSLTRLLRITAWCRRIIAFNNLCKSKSKIKKNNFTLEPEEIEEARLFWIKHVQAENFSFELEQLSRLQPIHRNSSLFRLTPFIDSKGLLRIGGRLRNAKIDFDMKHPIILPRESHFTKLVLHYTHRMTLHGGVQLMLATIRRSYWIIGGRNPVRAFIHRCVTCTRYRATTAKQSMGQLPTTRTLSSRPFLHSGVDYAGPFSLKTWKGRGAKTYKGYLIIFVCFSSSAVHLELSTDYSTQGFLAAYKRFTGRRGICSTLTSDCGSNLVGADVELRKLFRSASKDFKHLVGLLANDGTKWIFNPPAAPHFGGKWEAAVKSSKFHIKRVIGDTVLTYEEFATFLVQVEAVLNSRPICPLSDDPSDLEALTPGHFIVGEAIQTVPEPSLSHIKDSRLSRYQLLRKMLEKFWERWSIEYIQRLQEVVKWHKPSQNIKEGSLVLVVDERYPPSKWQLARVLRTHPGADGLVRVVTVKTQTSTLKRPIVKLCLLPVPTDKVDKEIG